MTRLDCQPLLEGLAAALSTLLLLGPACSRSCFRNGDAAASRAELTWMLRTATRSLGGRGWNQEVTVGPWVWIHELTDVLPGTDPSETATTVLAAAWAVEIHRCAAVLTRRCETVAGRSRSVVKTRMVSEKRGLLKQKAKSGR